MATLIKDYEGTEYGWDTINKLATQIPSYFDTSRISGGVLGTTGESVGFNYGDLSNLLGRAPSSQEQVSYDMARWLARNGITDISQLTPTTNPIAKPQSDFDLGIDPNTYRFGETFTGEGGTSYWLNFDEAGRPVISTSGFSTSDKGKIAKALAVGGLLFGGASLLGGLGGGTAAGAGAAGLGPIELAIAAGEGIVPLTAAQTATTGLTAAQLGALGSGIGLSGGTGLFSSVSNYLTDPKNAKTITDLAKAGINLASLGGAMANTTNQAMGGVPTQGIPVNTSEYFNTVQGFLNQYLLGQMPNQAGYLADWYGGSGLFNNTQTGAAALPKPPVKLIPGLDEGQSARYAQLSPEDQKKYLALAGAYNAPGDQASDAALVRDYMRSAGLDESAIAALAGVDPQMVSSYLGQIGLNPQQLAQYQSLGYGGQDIYRNLVNAYQAPGTVQEDAQQVLQVMRANNLTPADLAIITGIPEAEVNAYLAQATPAAPSMMAGPIEVDNTPATPTYTTQDIVNAYQQAVIGGGMDEKTFVDRALAMPGVTKDDLLAAQAVLLGK